jgi:multidrug efflux pump subunit AcrA (membrane-fusion protein)
MVLEVKKRQTDWDHNMHFCPIWRTAGALILSGVVAVVSGCAHDGSDPAPSGLTASRVVPVTVAPLEHRTVERTVEVIGTLRGWEQVTLGTKRTGRVVKVHHDMGDRVKPGEPLVELDPVDAKLGVQQAESKYLGELVKLGITKRQAEDFVKRYGISEELLIGQVADAAITKVPAVVQKRVAKEKAVQNLARQRALTQRGAGTPQELEDAENELRTSAANYDDAIQTARTVIATAVASKVALGQSEQTLIDMTIRAPTPKLLPPGLTRTSPLSYGVTKRQVSEGQMIKEGEAVVELIIEDPVRLWSQVPEQYAEGVRVGQRVRISTRAHPGVAIEGTVARINPSVDSSSRTFQVETLVPNERGLLRPGGFAKASIVIDAETQAPVVPVESIVRFAGVTKLFIVENGKARSINDIKTGSEGRGWVEVASQQLPSSADVVTTGQSQLAEGTPVVVREPEPPAEPATTSTNSGPTTAAAVRPLSRR